MRQASLFISHGSPTFALEPGLLGPQLSKLGNHLPRPRAVLVVSPHWMSRQLEILAAPALDTVHDFGGFPAALYRLSYAAPGAPDIAVATRQVLARAGLDAVLNTERGRDHGAWVPLMHLYPEADIPVIQLSQPATPSPLALFELGQALAPLRDQGVMIIGSGSLTHNLYELRRDEAAQDADEGYARHFADWVWAQIEQDRLDALFDYRRQAPAALRAHPTDEHFLPLFLALGAAQGERRQARRLRGGTTYGVLAMDSFVFGGPSSSADTSATATEALSATPSGAPQ